VAVWDLFISPSLLCEEAYINYRAHEKREGAQREKGLGHENQKRERKAREREREGGRLLELDRGAGPAVQIGGGESSPPRTSSGSVPVVLLILPEIAEFPCLFGVFFCLVILGLIP
jgi:hypothetical protein